MYVGLRLSSVEVGREVKSDVRQFRFVFLLCVCARADSVVCVRVGVDGRRERDRGSAVDILLRVVAVDVPATFVRRAIYFFLFVSFAFCLHALNNKSCKNFIQTI